MRRVILDCDPGHDDALAIMLACASPELELLGVTTVAGNQTVEKTTLNALKVLTLIGEPIPVARGSGRPLVRELVTAPEVHGESGLDGAELPPPSSSPLDVHAVDFIVRAAREPLTIIATGPLTNIALALSLAPEIAGRVEIVLMGGGIGGGNVTPAAEFNFYVDPEAAAIVLSSGAPVTMVGLNVTNRALLAPEEIEGIASLDGPVSAVAADLLRFYAAANERLLGIRGAPLHDPLAVAAAIDPGVIRTEELYVGVETRGELTRGAAVVDLHRVTGEAPNARVAVDLDLQRFKGMILRALEVLDRRAPGQDGPLGKPHPGT